MFLMHCSGNTASLTFLGVDNPKDAFNCFDNHHSLAFLGAPEPLSELYKETRYHRPKHYSSAITPCLHLCHKEPLNHKQLMKSKKVCINLRFMSWFNVEDTLLSELLANFMMYSPPECLSSPYVPIHMRWIPSTAMGNDDTHSSDKKKVGKNNAGYGRAAS